MPAGADASVQVRGLRELQSALRRADRHSRTIVRSEMRQVAEPVRRESESRATSQIRRMPLSPRWSKMRVGVTSRVVYVAPVQRGVKTRGADPRRRPNLANLLMDRAMEPALEHNEHEIAHGLEVAFDRIADEFNRGGGAL